MTELQTGTAPAPTETPTEHLTAWALDESDEPLAHRGPLAWVALTALAVALLGLVTALTMVWLHRPTQTAQPAPNVTVTKSLAPPVEIPPVIDAPIAAAPEDPDARFLALLSQAGFDVDDKAGAITTARHRCAYLDSHSRSALVSIMMHDTFSDGSMPNEGQVDAVINASTAAYCPQHG